MSGPSTCGEGASREGWSKLDGLTGSGEATPSHKSAYVTKAVAPAGTPYIVGSGLYDPLSLMMRGRCINPPAEALRN